MTSIPSDMQSWAWVDGVSAPMSIKSGTVQSPTAAATTTQGMVKFMHVIERTENERPTL